jgi:hypothetical protein
MYCGNSVVVEEAIRLAVVSGPDAATLIGLGDESLQARQHKEAYSYFSRATEQEPTNPSAWLGKARASAGQATLGDMRNDEVTHCCKKYIELSGSSEAAVTVGIQFLTDYASILANAADDFFVQYGGRLVGPMGSMVPAPDEDEVFNWVNRSIVAINIHTLAIDFAENSAKGELPTALRGVLGTIRPIIDKCYMAYIHCPPSDSKRSVPVSMNPETRKSMLQMYEYHRKQLAEICPETSTEFLSVDQIFEKQNKADAVSSSMCFVATACYGSEDAKPVLALRDFRDKVLSTTELGRQFISIYYKYGPYAASYIGRRPILRVIVRDVICTPASVVAGIVTGRISKKSKRKLEG